MGYAPFESADPRSEGLIGVGGVWIDTLADIETAFEGIDVPKIRINQTGSSIPVLCMIAALAEKRGVPADRLRGTVQNYVLPWGEPPDFRGNHYIDIIELCARELPRWNHTSVSVRNTRESGISAAQEIAFGLYQGVLTIEAAVARGVDVDAFAPRLSFFLNRERFPRGGREVPRDTPLLGAPPARALRREGRPLLPAALPRADLGRQPHGPAAARETSSARPSRRSRPSPGVRSRSR